MQCCAYLVAETPGGCGGEAAVTASVSVENKKVETATDFD